MELEKGLKNTRTILRFFLLKVTESRVKNLAPGYVDMFTIIRILYELILSANFNIFSQGFKPLPNLENFTCLGASSYEPGSRAGSVTGTNSMVCHMGNFSPVDRDEFKKQNLNDGT